MVRRPIFAIRNHEHNVPIMPSAYCPIDSEKEFLASMPACFNLKMLANLCVANNTQTHEIREVTHQVLATQSLNQPNSNNDLGSAKIDSLETIAIAHANSHLFLDLVGVFD